MSEIKNGEEKNIKDGLELLLKNNQIDSARELLITPEADRVIYEENIKLRKEVESIENWKLTKEKAKKELSGLPSDLVETLMGRFREYIDELPAGHGKGHMKRDYINLSVMMGDPEFFDKDEVELAVGVLGGIFHDIGNSIVTRYHDSKRLASHSEVGAFLFDVLAKDLIPENLLKLTKYAIAAHTHYKEMNVKHGDYEVVRKAYEDEISDEGDRWGVWMTRQTDRMDTQGTMFLARHFVLKGEPHMDFSWEDGFSKLWSDEQEDFAHQFTPGIKIEVKKGKKNTLVARTAEEKRKLGNSPEKTQTLLEHCLMFAQSTFNNMLPYSRYDSDYYSNTIMRFYADKMEAIIETTVKGGQNFTEEERLQTLDRVLSAAKKIEPGKNVGSLVEKFKKKFLKLPIDLQDQWISGMQEWERQYKDQYKQVNEWLGKTGNVHTETQAVSDMLEVVRTKALKIHSEFNLSRFK